MLYGFAAGLPNGQVPVLEIDDYVLPHSMAILRYIGKLSGKERYWRCCNELGLHQSDHEYMVHNSGFSGITAAAAIWLLLSFVSLLRISDRDFLIRACWTHQDLISYSSAQDSN